MGGTVRSPGGVLKGGSGKKACPARRARWSDATVQFDVWCCWWMCIGPLGPFFSNSLFPPMFNCGSFTVDLVLIGPVPGSPQFHSSCLVLAASPSL